MWEHSGACSKSPVAVTAKRVKKREQERGDGMEMCDEREADDGFQTAVRVSICS